MKDIFETIKTRRSMRKYKKDMPDEGLIKMENKILKKSLEKKL